MSVGGLIGAVVGGVIGFFIGGPLGAVYGASLGFSLGMIIDPMTPDIPSPGAPLPESSEVMESTVGVPLPDLLGTAKISGHLLCYGKERTVTIYAETSGGKGGDSPDPQVSGYEYYMSWAVGVCAGPIDTIYAIYKGDDVVWEGELHIPTASGTYGQETIILTEEGPEAGVASPSGGGFLDIPFPDELIPSIGMGTATFYFGTSDQVVNSNVGEIIGDNTLNSPYRNLCWCYFNNCYIGKFNRCPTMKFIVRKSPELSFSAYNTIQVYDYNPIHAAWYTLHNLAGLSEDWLHVDDFNATAYTLAMEARGISCLFRNQQNTLNYLESINKHIDGIIRYGSDGKFHPKLIRDDYIVDDLALIDEDVLLEDPTLTRKSWIDTVNEVKVQYTEIVNVSRDAYIYNLFLNDNLFGAPPRIIGLHFNGVDILTEVGTYLPTDGAHGLILYDDDLITIGGEDATATMLRIGTKAIDEVYPLLDSYPITNQYDVTTVGLRLASNEEESRIFYADSARRLIKFNDYTRDDRGFHNTVTTGTDGHLYYARDCQTAWHTRPPAVNWQLYWGRIEDDICDGPIIPWGFGTVYNGGNLSFDFLYHNEKLYLTNYDSPYSYLRKFNPDTLAVEANVVSAISYRIIGLSDRIYSIRSAFSTTLSMYSANDLALLGEVAIPDGRFGAIAAVGEYIIVITNQYTTTCGIFKINPITLEIVDSLLFTDKGYSTLAAIGDDYVAAGHTTGVSVFSLSPLEMVANVESTYGKTSGATVVKQ